VSVSLLRSVHHVPGVRGFVRKQVLRSVARVVEWTTHLPGRPLNLDRVDGRLWVGGHIAPRHYPRLAALGIGCVVDVRAERCDDEGLLAAQGMRLLHLPAPDRYALPVEALIRGVQWALPLMAQGHQVFCHCEHGVGRGPSMALVILVAQGMAPAEAYRALRRARWQAILNDRQLEGLARFVAHWEQRRTSYPAAG
jgi:protein-tyrosine phosphatase